MRVDARKPEIDEMWMIEAPSPRCSSIGSAACEARTIAITSTDRPLDQPASSSPMPKPDALFTSTSMPPSAAPASLT